MRQVRFIRPDQNIGEGFSFDNCPVGYFHGLVLDAEAVDGGFIQVHKAMIEDKNGDIHIIVPWGIKFSPNRKREFIEELMENGIEQGKAKDLAGKYL